MEFGELNNELKTIKQNKFNCVMHYKTSIAMYLAIHGRNIYHTQKQKEIKKIKIVRPKKKRSEWALHNNPNIYKTNKIKKTMQKMTLI